MSFGNIQHAGARLITNYERNFANIFFFFKMFNYFFSIAASTTRKNGNKREVFSFTRYFRQHVYKVYFKKRELPNEILIKLIKNSQSSLIKSNYKIICPALTVNGVCNKIGLEA